MSRWTIRPPRQDDLPELAALGRKTFADTFGHLYPAQDLAAFQEQVWGAEGLPAEFRAGERVFRVAEVDGGLVAFAKLGKPYLPVPDVDPARRRIELCQLYVDTPWHGTGLAQALMDWAIAYARAEGFEDMYLSVYVDNHRAQRFYARYGFKEVGRYEFRVGDQIDDDRIWHLKLR